MLPVTNYGKYHGIYHTRLVPSEETGEVQTLYLQKRLMISIAIHNLCSADKPVSSSPKGGRIDPGIIDAELTNVNRWNKESKKLTHITKTQALQHPHSCS